MLMTYAIAYVSAGVALYLAMFAVASALRAEPTRPPLMWLKLSSFAMMWPAILAVPVLAGLYLALTLPTRK